MNSNVHLGYEVGTGKAVMIPLRHMVVTGITQEAGKTTTLEALIARANLPAIAFVTKRGERSFDAGRRIEPYFRERADWQFVVSVLEATMRERLKFERAWIMRASKGARTLADVHNNVRKQLLTAKGLSGDVYLTLDAYLEIVVPRIAQVRFASTLDLDPGLNVLDLSDRDRFPPELQSLVMRSALEWVYAKCNGTITIIPEAWEFCLSEDTDVLTRSGWRRGIEIARGDEIMCFDHETESSAFEAVQQTIVRDHNGPMVPMHGKWADALCTPDHRVLMKGFSHETGQPSENWRFVPAWGVGHQFIVPTPRPVSGPGVPDLSPRMLRILGWVITDGWWHTKDKYISLEQALTTRKLGRQIAEEMREVLSVEGATVRVRSRGPTRQILQQREPSTVSDSLTFYFGAKLSARVIKWIGSEVHRIPRAVLNMASDVQLRALFDGLMEGDGTTKRGVWSAFYPGLNEGLADDFQELCTRLGIRAVKSWAAKQWRISLSDRRDAWIRRKPTVDYTGRVWDVTVPSGAFVIRRNGRVFVTGNCPQGRGSPVKLAAVELIRKGAGLANYVWLDSQDIGGVDKELLRSCPVWLLGVQREANEIKRVLDNIPAGIAKPKPADVAKLKKGQFYACFGDSVIKTYVQPAWMSEMEAIAIANGAVTIDQAAARPSAPQPEPEEEDMSSETDKKLDTLIGLLTLQATSGAAPAPAAPISFTPPYEKARPADEDWLDEEAMYQKFKARLIKESPAILRVLTAIPQIEVRETRETIEVDGKSLRGRLALLILKGFFDQAISANAAFNEFVRVGFKIAKPSVYAECDKLTTMGFLTKDDGYQAVAAMKSSIKKAA